MKKFPALSRTRPAAFTLAEVMIALGIVASVMIGMLAMIPHAVRSIKESNNLTIMGRIAQELISNIQMSEWDRIDEDYKDKRIPYDNEGLRFEAKQGQEPTYECRIELLPEQVSVSKEFEYRPEHLRKIKIAVEYIPGGTPNKDPLIRKKNTKTYNFLVANQNKLKVQ
ncbi:MAG TPA: Verru_Chthon cassette protein B [Verrucomicrobiales bacterium]|nr:Verru_Chthon cassette protein B [Verrucomicrobiales bacterium]